MHIKDEEKAHQAKIAKQFLKEHKAKFYTGCLEHADQGMLKDIPPKQLVEFALEEVLDLASYLYTLRDALRYSEEHLADPSSLPQ